MDVLDDLVAWISEGRPEGLFDDGGFARQLRLQRQDAGDAVDIVGVVEPAATQPGQVCHEPTSESLPMATEETVILSFCIRRTRPAKSADSTWPSEKTRTWRRRAWRSSMPDTPP